jgi:hypothetical protein
MCLVTCVLFLPDTGDDGDRQNNTNEAARQCLFVYSGRCALDDAYETEMKSNTLRFRRAAMALLGLLACILTACGGGGSNAAGPSQTCQTAGATNIGGPLPCTFSVPAVSFVNMVQTGKSPTDGGTLSYTPPDSNVDTRAFAFVAYNLSQVDRDQKKALGADIRILACLYDTMPPTVIEGGCQRTSPLTDLQGQIDVHPYVPIAKKDTMAQVQHLFLQLELTVGTTFSGQVIATQNASWSFTLTDPR